MRLVHRLAWPFAVVLAVLAAAAPGLVPGRTLAWRDTLMEFVPLRATISAALRSGRLPLWDPWDGTGMPLFAQMYHGVLHPAAAMLSILAPGASIDVLLVIDLLLAALGAYVAARAFGASRAGAAVAGIGFGCSGYVLGSLANFPFLVSAASFPWLVTAGRSAGGGSRFGATASALAMAMTVMAGDVFAVVVGGALGAAAAFDAGRRRGLLRFMGGGAVGALVASVQLIPAWSMQARSSRALELSTSIRSQWALSPWRIIEVVAPGFFGGRPGVLVAPVFQALDAPTMFTLPFCTSIFLGVGLLAAALAGARSRSVRPLALAIPILLWIALGHHLGSEQVLHFVPLWGRLRYTEKLVAPIAFCVAMLAAVGVERFAEAMKPRRAMAALALVLLAFFVVYAPWSGATLLGPLLGPALEVGRAQLGEGLLHTAAGLGGVLACLVIHRRAPRALPAAVVALVAIEALAASPFAVHATPLPLSEPPAITAPAPGPRICTPSFEYDVHGPSPMDGLANLEAALGFPGFNVVAPVENVWIYTALPSRRFDYLYEAFQKQCRPYRRFSTTHVLLPAGLTGTNAAAATAGGELIRRDERVEVWAVPHRPWASFAVEARAIRKQRETLTATIENMRSDREEVIVEADEAPAVAPGTVLSVRRGIEQVEIEAEASGPALLVVNDAYWPGWEARIDGALASILPADVMVRAVPFPAGRHRLVMTYSPPEVNLGVALSAVGLAFLVAVAAMEWRNRPGTPSP